MTGDFDFMELCEFSFSEEVTAMNATPMTLQPEVEVTAILPDALPDTTAMATETTLLSPRFYTTDFDEMDRIDVTPVRAEWDKLIAPDEVRPEQDPLQEDR